MIWFAILILYFVVGYFIGYRVHRLKVLLKTKKMEENARVLAGLYNDVVRERDILLEEHGAAQRIRFANENTKLKDTLQIAFDHFRDDGNLTMLLALEKSLGSISDDC